jgi:hypothetical protein
VKDCPLSALSLSKRHAEKDEDEDAEPAYFSIVNSVPVYDFMVQVSAKTLQIQKVKCSMRDLIATIPILEETCAALFPPTPTTAKGHTPSPPSLVDLLNLKDRIHRVSFRFEHRLRVINYITQPTREATNLDVISKLARTSIPAGHAGTTQRDAPLVCLQPFTPYRGDVTLSVEKTIAKRKRNVWIIMEAPFNISQKDVDLVFSYRTGEGRSEVKAEDMSDWTTPFTSFYRDIVLNEFLPALFFDINIEPRIS